MKAGEPPKEVLDFLDITRYCCRRMMISHIEIIDELLKIYEKDQSEVREG